VFLAAQMSSETTAAATGAVGELRFDPMAMLPFCGYHMGDYFSHWLRLGHRDGAQLPKIFMVNWFRKNAEGKFIWPGFGENSRVLAWIFGRCDGTVEAEETAIGYVPRVDSADAAVLEIPGVNLAELVRVDPKEWAAQLDQVKAHFDGFGKKLPPQFKHQMTEFEERLGLVSSAE
jgi:phosphoenolpyruvate carboxykinase (GTP)